MSAQLDRLMMDYPLTLTHFFERSRRLFSKKTLATRIPGRPLFRHTYADFAERTTRLAGALRALGLRKGDRVATLAWNSHRHLEIYWAAPLVGCVLHTLNFRLSAQDLTYIVNHAEDAVIFADASVWPVLEAIRDTIPHIVPMFHANAWCLPFTGVMVGSTQIFAGPSPQPRDICELVQNERVTFTGAVPTVWIAVKDLCEKEGWNIASLRTIAIGGSAAPKHLQLAFKNQFGVVMSHAWGMTEMTPLGTIARLKSYMRGWSEDAQYDVRARVGYPSVGVDVRIVDDAGRELPWNATSMGELQVRGPWVVGAYYNNPESAARFTEDGWFRTGDVATIDPEGYVQITDRTKDLIKSGGEWISSVDLENMIMSHPKVLEAAVIAVPHPKWVERPLAW